MPDSFIDTNVIVYLASGDIAKAQRAEEVIVAGGTISVQVSSELTDVARRKMHLSWNETHAFLSLVRELLPAVAVTVQTHETGILLAERYSLSVYDAMILASALLADGETSARRTCGTGPSSKDGCASSTLSADCIVRKSARL